MTPWLELLTWLAVAVGINLIGFIPAYFLKTDKLTDLSYSLSFLTIIVAATVKHGLQTSTKVIIACLIGIWALRLGTFLVVRIHKMKRDRRFDGIRESPKKFLKFWLLQGIAVWIILIPFLLFAQAKQSQISLLGCIIWLGGFLLESIADYQKFKFKQKTENKEKFIQSGLWKYSRHPNYFGEIVCWVGIYITVLPALNITQALIALVSPAFITIVLVFLTGIPPLEKNAEKKWGKRKEYQDYKKKTSLLLLWPPQK